MRMESNYKKLIVWQKAMRLTTGIYRNVKKLPKEELFALSDQMRRAVVSIPSNIAEGCGRQSLNEMSYFLRIASGSASELESQLLICKNLGYLNDEDLNESMPLLNEIIRMLSRLGKRTAKSLSSTN